MSSKKISFQIWARLKAREISKEQLFSDGLIDKRKFYLCCTDRQNWSLDDLQKISKFLSCKIEDLMEEIPQQYK